MQRLSCVAYSLTKHLNFLDRTSDPGTKPGTAPAIPRYPSQKRALTVNRNLCTYMYIWRPTSLNSYSLNALDGLFPYVLESWVNVGVKQIHDVFLNTHNTCVHTYNKYNNYI